MALSADIKSILSASTSLTAAVAARIYPVIAPEKPVLPCVVYTVGGLTPTETKTASIQWDNVNVTVSAIASKFEDAETYGNYIRTAMNRYKDTIGSDVIKGCQLTSQDWEYIPDLSYSGASTGVAVFAVNMQFTLFVKQNISE